MLPNCKIVTPPFSYSTVVVCLINSMRYGVLNFSNFEYTGCLKKYGMEIQQAVVHHKHG